MEDTQGKKIKLKVLSPFATAERAFSVGKVYTVADDEQTRQWLSAGIAEKIGDSPSPTDVLNSLEELGVKGICFDELTNEGFLNAARERRMTTYKIF